MSGIESLAEHLPIGVYRTTPDGRVLYANPAFASVVGAGTVSEAERLDVRWDLGYPRDAFEDQLQKSGRVRNLVVRWTQASGRTVHTRENARVVRDDRGRVRYYEGTLEDVSDEIAVAAAERLRARQYAAAVRFADAAQQAGTTADLHRDALDAFQDAFQAEWALLVRPLAGRNRVVAERGLTKDARAFVESDEVFATAPLPRTTSLVPSVDASARLSEPVSEALGRAGLVAFAAFPLVHQGQILGSVVVGFGEAPTFTDGGVQGGEMLAWHLAGHLARRLAEQSLEDTEATLQFVAEHTGHVLYRRLASGEYDYLSPGIEALTGYTPAALAATGGFPALRVEDGQTPASPSDTPSSVRYRIRTRDRGVRVIEDSSSAWWEPSGRVLGVVGVLHDVTARTLHDEAQVADAERSAMRQSALVELATAGADPGLPDLVFAQACELVCGATAADQASVWIRDAEHVSCRGSHGLGDPVPAYPNVDFEAMRAAMTGQRALLVEDVWSDERAAELGLEAFAEASGATGLLVAPIRHAGETVGALILHRVAPAEASGWGEADIAFAAAVADAAALALERDERARAQRALEASETRYRVLAELTSDYAFAALADADGHGPIDWATDAFERISGYAPSEIGTTDALRAIVHPSSLTDVRRAFADLMATGAADFEARIVARDGAVRWVHHRARVTDGGVVYHSGEDVTERKRVETDLVEARERAEAMGRLKSAFLANMNHEIRTPLTAILGYSDLLLDELEDDQRDFVVHIARSGVRLLDTLNSVLDLARLEADGLELQVRPVTVADHVQTAIAPYRDEASRAGLGFHVDVDATVQAELDPACLERIVTNLVGNAVKFTEAGGVAVEIEADADHVRLHVRDTGVGMDAPFLETLFDDFQQESSGYNRSHEGSGLGLSITKRYVDLLGGTIAVETQKGVGTSFVVAFPLVAARPCSSEAGVSAEQGSPSAVAGEPLEAVDEAVLASCLAGGSDLDAAGLPHDFPSPAAFEKSATPADTPHASAVSAVTPPTGSAEEPPLPAHPDPSLPTDMFPNRSDRTAPGAAPTPPPQEPPSAPAPQGTSPMIVRGPAPSAGAPGWPAAPAPPPASPAPATSASGWPAAPAPPAPSAAPVPAPPAAPATSEAPEDDKPAILVVEDNDDTRMLLDRILRSTYTVTAVGDARSALIEMNRNQFAGLVLDINLGGKETGADILRIARTLDGYTDVFAIALTAYALPGDRERLLEAGFDEYISKPFTRHSLMEALSVGIAT